MKMILLDKICESYLIKNEVYNEINNEQFKKIKTYIVNELHTNLTNLYNTDIEMYHKFIDRPIYVQTQIVEFYLKLRYSTDEVLTEGFMFTAGMYLGLAVFASKPISKIVAQGVDWIAGITDKLGKFISTISKELKLRYAIVYKNLDACYKEAGVQPDDLSAFHYTGVNDDPVFPQFSPNIAKQTEKLKECYVAYQIETLSMLFKAYFLCISKTGDAASIKKLQDDDLLKVLSGLQLSTVCKEYYNIIKDSFDSFYKLLDLIYDKDSKKAEKLSDLKSALIKARDFSNKQSFKSDNKSYDNKSYDNKSKSTIPFDKFNQGKQFDNKSDFTKN